VFFVDFVDKVHAVTALFVFLLHYLVKFEVSSIEGVIDEGWVILVTEQLASTENFF
jgi:hypothetical protein